MHQVKENVENSGRPKRSSLWSKCAAEFGKVAKCAAGAKSLRTTVLTDQGVAAMLSTVQFSSV